MGHADGTCSHDNDYTLDTTPTSCTSGYVRGSSTRISPPSFGSEQYRSAAGNTCTDEGDHWDVLSV